MSKKFDEKIGKIEILGHEFAEKGYKIYKCKCLSCGKLFSTYPAAIRRDSEYGCPDCAKNERQKIDFKRLKEEHVGKIYGNLEVLEIMQKEGSNGYFAKCRCKLCGGISTPALSPLTHGRITSDKCVCAPNLQTGRDIMEDASVEGTCIFSLHQKLSKNNTSGVKGVSYVPKTGRWRATISFKRKQYYLGSYVTIEEAAEARKIAEKKIFGDFEKWYAEAHPEKYEKIKPKINKQDGIQNL